eukprot:Clim_evm18s3 gene=Clim_evmTU18s3
MAGGKEQAATASHDAESKGRKMDIMQLPKTKKRKGKDKNNRPNRPGHNPVPKKPRMADRDPVGARMKDYELEYAAIAIDRTKPYIIRLDGHRFSRFTQGFSKPYDQRFVDAMKETAMDLLQEYSATCAYTCSDEISLFFPPAGDTEIAFNGRIMKTCTIMAGYCSVRFNLHLSQQQFDEQKDRFLLKKVRGGMAHFDARLFHVPNEMEAYENLKWRSIFDCKRNSVSALAQRHFKPRVLMSKNTKEMLRMLGEKGIHWKTYPDFYKFGWFIKKERYMKRGFNPRAKEEVIVERSRVAGRAINVENIRREDVCKAIVFAKTWNEVEAVREGTKPKPIPLEDSERSASIGKAETEEVRVTDTNPAEVKEATVPATTSNMDCV